MTSSKLETIKQFSQDTFGDAAAQVRLGFELETQALAGCEFGDLTSAVISKPKKLSPMQKQCVEAALRLEFVESIACGGNYRSIISRTLGLDTDVLGASSVKNNKNATSLLKLVKITLRGIKNHQHVSIFLLEKLAKCDADIQERAVDFLVALAMQKADLYEQYLPETYFSRTIPEVKKLVDRGLTYESDGTVDGPEIQTAGPNSFITCMQHADWLFSNMDMTIDERCSFHIHLSIPGIKHTYGRNLQIALMLSVLLTPDRPSALHDRWNFTPERDDDEDYDCDEDEQKSWLERYFDVRPSANKYSFVAHRGDTWEFRGFGNVSNADDARWCLKAAVKAMQRGYRLLHGIETLEGFSQLVKLGNNEVSQVLSALVARSRASDTSLLEVMERRGHMNTSQDNDLELQAA